MANTELNLDYVKAINGLTSNDAVNGVDKYDAIEFTIKDVSENSFLSTDDWGVRTSNLYQLYDSGSGSEWVNIDGTGRGEGQIGPGGQGGVWNYWMSTGSYSGPGDTSKYEWDGDRPLRLDLKYYTENDDDGTGQGFTYYDSYYYNGEEFTNSPVVPDIGSNSYETNKLTRHSLDQRHTDITGGDFLKLGYALKGNDNTGNPGGGGESPDIQSTLNLLQNSYDQAKASYDLTVSDPSNYSIWNKQDIAQALQTAEIALENASTTLVESTALTNVAVLGPNTSENNTYTLEISAESLQAGWNLESTDIVLKYNTDIFGEITANDITIAGELPIKNSISVDDENGLIRFAAASLSNLGEGSSILGENILASINLDFEDSYFQDTARNPDANGKFTFDGNPLGFELSANSDETVFSRTFDSDAEGKELAGGAFKNREIKSLGDLNGNTTFDESKVNLYQAEIKFDEQDNGLTFGTKRVIGANQGFTNLIRTGDTVTAQTSIENIGNSLAQNVTISDAGNVSNAQFLASRFLDSTTDSGSVNLSGGVFNNDFSYDDTKQESVNIAVDMKVTGAAGNVIDVTKGLFQVTAAGMNQNPETADTPKIFVSESGSKNLITFQGDLNYDGRVSMKDLAFLNAGAARQIENNGSVDAASVARDVDADFSGKIDLADLSILDNDWGKSLHTGTEDFTGSSDTLNWTSLAKQDGATWDNSSFTAQNAIEAQESYIGSLDAPASTTIGADTSSTSQDPVSGEESDPASSGLG